MKLKKLPTLKIKQTRNGAATIVHEINKLWVTAKLLFITIVLALVATAYVVGNSYYQHYVVEKQQIGMAKDAAFQGDGVVIDATANIIVAESKIPDNVARKYAVWIYEAAYRYSVDPVMILAIMSNESKFNYKAVSPTGPLGLMQVAFGWHKDKVDTPAELFDPKKNIFVGTQIVAEYGAKTNTEAEMLIRYNAQPGYAPVYATKVLATKYKYDREINRAIVESI